MSASDPLPSNELDHLRSRNKRLAEDRAYFQLILRLIEKLDPLVGLDDMLRNMLLNIVECIGGTNIKLYYWIGDELHYRDFLGAARCLEAIDDADVARVAASHEFVDYRGNPDEALLKDGVLRGSWTWTFPLLVGDDLVGIVKLENLHIHGASLGKYLPIFFSHVALILSNEIRNTIHRRAEEALRIATQRLQVATEAGIIGIWDWDIEHNELIWDASMYRLYGRREGDFGGAYDAWLSAVHPEDKAYADAEIQAALRGEREYAPEFRVIWPDGSVHHIKAASRTLRDETGAPLRMVGINYDLTERKHAEEIQRRLNRELRAISDCNQALMHAEDEQTLLNEVCRIICDEAGYRVAWVGYADHDEARTVRRVASAGIDDGYFAEARITWSDTDRGRGPAGTAIRSGKTVYIQDFATDRRMTPWREVALRRGYRSGIGLPLKDAAGKVFGVLLIYSVEANAITPDEIRLLEELAGDLAFGITVLRSRIELRQAEQERQAYLHFLEGMERVNHAIQGASSPEQMLGDALEVVLSLLDGDRISLVHPCDPDAPEWRIVMERAKPDVPLFAGHGPMAMYPERANSLRRQLEAEGPLIFGPQGDAPLSATAKERFGIQSYMAVLLRPRTGKPWELGIQACATARVWTLEERRLFQEVGRRLDDALTNMLIVQELSESERQLKEAEHIAHVGSWDVDIVNDRLVWSDEIFRIWEIDKTKFKADFATFLETVHPEDRERVNRVYNEAIATHSLYEVEHRLLFPDGRVKYILERGEPRYDGQGKPVHFLGTSLDITERKRTEEAMLAHEREFRTLAENSPDVIVRYDRECRRIYVNPEFERINQLSAAAALGKSPQQLATTLAPKVDVFTHKLQAVMDSGVAAEIDLAWEKEGKPVCWYVRVVPERDAAGNIVSALTIWTDITERKQAEEELRRHRQRLEEEVALRTQELSQARDQAEAANRMKSIFLSNMSHELRTPLNAILGFAQIMERDDRIPEDERHNLATINRSGRHLLALINDVLEISRIEAGRLTLQPTAFDLPDMIASLRELLEPRARTKGLELRFTLPPDLPHYVFADAGKLRQVLLNLLSNAIKYTETGEIGLSVAADTTLASSTLRFVVRDTGVGIADKDKENIFHPFFQTDYGSALGEGTGLGLTISREYAQLMGGELRVESELYRGSAFTLLVPLQTAEDAMPTHPAHGPVVGLAAGQPTYRVLVVEDDAASQYLLKELLTQAGFQVLAAGNGEEALHVFQSWRPDFIWMDMRMPVMDGYEATRRIRALPGGREVKIAALTASAFREDRGEILAAGCDDVLSKPLDEEQLFAAMERLLGLRYRYAEAPASAVPASDIDLAGLPLALRDQLCRAARLLDVEATEQAIGRVRDVDPHVAEELEELVSTYRYDRIIFLCDSIQDPGRAD
ncbi:MAG: PAS domain S-box protein [Rhodocyclaceae bacterium]|nr:PAS domain S-box protein [Rhodocyclaceae bacterium]